MDVGREGEKEVAEDSKISSVTEWSSDGIISRNIKKLEEELVLE